MSPRARFLSLVAAASGALFARPVMADAVAHEDVFGHEVRVERSAEGELSISIAGSATPVALAPGGTPRIRRVTLANGVALVIEVDGPAPTVAIVAGSRTADPAVLLVRRLVHQGEDVGDRFTTEVHVADFDGDGAEDVVVGERHDDVRLCAVGRPLVNTTVVSTQFMRLLPVALNPLRADLAEHPPPAAREIVAVSAPGPAPALPTLLPVAAVANGASRTPPAALADHNDATAWRFGDREFVTVRATLAGLHADRLVLTAPAAPASLPRAFSLFFEPGDVRLDVTVPATLATTPGARIAVPLVPPRAVRCVSLMVVAGPGNGPPRAVAEMALTTEADRAPDAAGTLAARLDGPDGDEAAQLLTAMGPAATAPLASALPALPEGGARRAVRVLATMHTPEAAAALVVALARAELADDARLALQHMGPAALDALSRLLPTDARAADLIATIVAPADARMRALLPALGAPPAVWHDARGPLRAVVAEVARATGIESWLALVPEAPGAAARALTVAAEAAASDAQRATVAARARAVRAESFEDRFRLLRSLVGDAEGRARVADVALHDADDDLRAEAVRSLAAAGGAVETLGAALGDRVPRVRIEAAAGLAGVPSARPSLLERLASDTWPTVRAAAAASLAGDAANVPALARATADASSVVAVAALTALARTDEPTVSRRLMEYAETGSNPPDLRIEALAALARRCDRSVVDRLMPLFNRENDPMLPPAEQAVGHAALAALAHIDPVRARTEFARLQVNAMGMAALQRAMQRACPAH